jgi:hypothetical protein
MRLSRLSFAALTLAVAATGHVDADQRGVVNGLALDRTSAQVGATVSATITGSNPCGAVLVDWGDGTAVTHPIYQLPETRDHVYATPGRYRVSARGQGNCDGEATATVRIDAPKPGRPRLTGFQVQSPGTTGAAVTMVLEGNGTCTVRMAFGDGNTQELSVSLPHSLTHVYSAARSYNVSAAAVPPCDGGRHTSRLDVARQAATPSVRRLSGLSVVRDTGAGRRAATIEVTGSGTCTYVLEFGDGNQERRTASLPDRVPHVFPSTGTFTVVATAMPPCEGKVQDTMTVGRPDTSIGRLLITPSPAQPGSRVSITIEGRGTCTVTVDFGDGQDETIEAALPARVFHTFARAGRYEVIAWTEAPCTGNATAAIVVRR